MSLFFRQDLVTIHHRSFLHHFGTIPVAFVFLRQMTKAAQIIASKFQLQAWEAFQNLAFKLPYIVLISWTSHQLRDGLRRGVSFYPLFVTPPLPFQLYVVAITLTPNLIHYSIYLMKKSNERESASSV